MADLKKSVKLIALQKALRDLKIEHVITKKDGPLIIMNLWVGEE